MMPTRPFKEESRKNWYDGDKEKLDLEQLTFGALQRIADATETMAQDHDRLMRRNKWLEQSNVRLIKEAEHLRRRLAATQGVVTKLKNKQKGSDADV